MDRQVLSASMSSLGGFVASLVWSRDQDSLHLLVWRNYSGTSTAHPCWTCVACSILPSASHLQAAMDWSEGVDLLAVVFSSKIDHLLRVCRVDPSAYLLGTTSLLEVRLDQCSILSHPVGHLVGIRSFPSPSIPSPSAPLCLFVCSREAVLLVEAAVGTSAAKVLWCDVSPYHCNTLPYYHYLCINTLQHYLTTTILLHHLFITTLPHYHFLIITTYITKLPHYHYLFVATSLQYRCHYLFLTTSLQYRCHYLIQYQ